MSGLFPYVNFGWPGTPSWYWHGVLMHALGSVLCSVAWNVIGYRRKKGAENDDGGRSSLESVEADDSMVGPLSCLSFGPLAWILLAIGIFSQFFAYQSTPASVLCPLASLEFSTHLVYSAAVYKQDIRRIAYVGYSVMFIAMVVILLSGPTQVQNYYPSEMSALIGRGQFVSYILFASSLTVFAGIYQSSIMQ